MRKLLLALLSLALTSSVGAESCCDSKGQYFRYSGGNTFYYPGFGIPVNGPTTSYCTTNCTLDAVDEMIAAVGYLQIEGHPSSAKTCSASGCKIYWKAGAVTAGTSRTLVVGLQDVSTTAGPPVQPDGTFDASASVTSSPTANAQNTATIGTGSKSVSDGQLLAVVFHLSAVNGASIVVQHMVGGNTIQHLPNVSYKLGGGAWAGAAAHLPNIIIEFDDGTWGWFIGGTPHLTLLNTTYKSDSTPDEKMMACNFKTPVSAIGMYAFYASPANADTDIILYSNACDGCVPVANKTVTLTDNMVQAAGITRMGSYGMTRTFLSGWWAVSLKPSQAAANVTLTQYTMPSASYLKAWGGTDCVSATSTDGGVITHSGTVLFPLGFIIDSLHN